MASPDLISGKIQLNTPALLPVGKDITESELIIKGRSRIDAVATADAKDVSATIRTWYVSRILRRDFYNLTVKMFWACRDSHKRRKIRNLLADLSDEAYVIDRSLEGAPDTISVHSTLTIRIISPEAQNLIDSIFLIDRALAHYMEANGELLSDASERCVAFFICYGRLKEFLFKFGQY